MKRAWLVVGTTTAGLLGVLAFHTSPTSLSSVAPLTGTPSAKPPATTPAAAGPPSPSGGTSSATTTAATRTATGATVNYFYGALSVAATVSGPKLTNVSIASIDDGGNFRSQSIDRAAVPVLEQEALAAQSANIQGVSGASYTSAGFEQSLQSALGELGSR